MSFNEFFCLCVNTANNAILTYQENLCANILTAVILELKIYETWQ